ncbi:conserved hypothetical protein [gamma proteobacterium HdN1]|nr:conserved hypothetical protein [gamma proteobacterium HdN1]
MRMIGFPAVRVAGFCLTLLAVFLSPALVAAEKSGPVDVVARGLEIMRAADARLHGYTDQQVSLEMTLISPSGGKASRALRVQSIETPDGERTLMVFETPRDLSGTALLSNNRRSGADEQWLYLPAIKRVKQIGARNKSGPFMGSEFAYEDIVTPFVEKYSYQYLEQTPCGELTCDVIERKPKDEFSGYSFQKVWIDTTHQLVRRIEYYDRKQTLLKTCTASGFSEYQSKYWRPAEMLMENHQSGKKTVLRWADYRFESGLSEQDFTQNALMRSR